MQWKQSAWDIFQIQSANNVAEHFYDFKIIFLPPQLYKL